MRRRSSMSETRSFFIESQRKKLTPFLEAILSPCLQLMCGRVAVVHDSSANNGVLDLCAANRLGRNLSQVPIDDDDIRELSGRERSLVFFLEGGVSAAGGVGPQRILDADLLLRNPAAGMFIVERSPRHRRVNPFQRSRRRHWPIAAKRQPRVGFLER